MNIVEVEHSNTMDKTISALSARSISSLQTEGELADRLDRTTVLLKEETSKQGSTSAHCASMLNSRLLILLEAYPSAPHFGCI